MTQQAWHLSAETLSATATYAVAAPARDLATDLAALARVLLGTQGAAPESPPPSLPARPVPAVVPVEVEAPRRSLLEELAFLDD